METQGIYTYVDIKFGDAKILLPLDHSGDIKSSFLDFYKHLDMMIDFMGKYFSVIFKKHFSKRGLDRQIEKPHKI